MREKHLNPFIVTAAIECDIHLLSRQVVLPALIYIKLTGIGSFHPARSGFFFPTLTMVKPYGGVKRPIDRSVRLEQMANKRIRLCADQRSD